MMKRAALFICAACVGVAPAAAQRPDPCARFDAPLAYNACLAEHGPHAPGTRPATADESAPAAARHGARGRSRLEFNVGGD